MGEGELFKYLRFSLSSRELPALTPSDPDQAWAMHQQQGGVGIKHSGVS